MVKFFAGCIVKMFRGHSRIPQECSRSSGKERIQKGSLPVKGLQSGQTAASIIFQRMILQNDLAPRLTLLPFMGRIRITVLIFMGKLERAEFRSVRLMI